MPIGLISGVGVPISIMLRARARACALDPSSRKGCPWRAGGHEGIHRCQWRGVSVRARLFVRACLASTPGVAECCHAEHWALAAFVSRQRLGPSRLALAVCRVLPTAAPRKESRHPNMAVAASRCSSHALPLLRHVRLRRRIGAVVDSIHSTPLHPRVAVSACQDIKHIPWQGR